MTKVTYIGGEAGGNVGEVAMGPHKFELNKPVEVTDEKLLGKLKGNVFFEVEGEPKREKPAAAAAEPEDDDDDTSKSKTSRSPLGRR